MAALEALLESCVERAEDPLVPSAREWKRANPDGKVLGYFPVYFPVELAHAAGMLPVAIFGGGNAVALKQADAHMYSFMCSICKLTLELGLTGRLDFLDVFIGTPICDAARHMPGLIERNMEGVTVDILYFPGNLATELAGPYLRREYARLVQLLESVTGRPVTADAIRASIRLYNRSRRLMRDLYDIRRRAPWQISTVETYAIVRAGTYLPVEDHIALLEQVLGAVHERPARPLDKVRVVFEGGFCEQPPLQFLRSLEDVCYVVDDDLILGARLLIEDVPEDGDPLASLADSYRERSCGSSVQHDMRRLKSDVLLAKCRAADAHALVLSPAKFCEPGLDDQVHHLKRAEREGIPALQMEFQERMKDFEGVRTQTETFAEAILFYAG